MPENVMTHSSRWKKLSSTNFTDSSFAAFGSSKSKPSGAGIISFRSEISRQEPAPLVQNLIQFKFFGKAAADKTFDFRLWGVDQELANDSWEEVLLAQFAVILGTGVGVANGAISASEFIADTITLTYGPSDIVISSPSNNLTAYAIVDFCGFSILKAQFDLGDATEANALYRCF